MRILLEQFYYYYEDVPHVEPDGSIAIHPRPRVTLCALVDDRLRVGYGWGICGPGDHFHRHDMEAYDAERQQWVRAPGGRTWARGRALLALTNAKRAVTCGQHAPDVYIFGRPILRPEALDTLADAHADGVMRLTTTRTTTALPPSMQPPQLREWAQRHLTQDTPSRFMRCDEVQDGN